MDVQNNALLFECVYHLDGMIHPLQHHTLLAGLYGIVLSQLEESSSCPADLNYSDSFTPLLMPNCQIVFAHCNVELSRLQQVKMEMCFL